MKSPGFILLHLFLLIVLLAGCSDQSIPGPKDPPQDSKSAGFPSYITPVSEYFQLSISGIPSISGNQYSLLVTGDVDTARSFSLQELEALPMVEMSLTEECIENPPGGSLMGTATWKGIRVYELLESVGIGSGATLVRYRCADGYYTYNTLEELRESDVIAALYMNGEVLPPDFGYPLRIIFPGHYGVRQPGWVVEMELMEEPVTDYWSRWGWRTDTATAVDSRIFFPLPGTELGVGDTVKVGGAAFGARRIAAVEITTDAGRSWIPASLRDSLDQDFAWVFWEASFVADKAGKLNIRARSTGKDGSVQPVSDDSRMDGNNAQPLVEIYIRK
jgi:DMSO/TMAO reductase YedYZ molybdopterin-dependent catalytic subunit